MALPRQQGTPCSINEGVLGWCSILASKEGVGWDKVDRHRLIQYLPWPFSQATPSGKKFVKVWWCWLKYQSLCDLIKWSIAHLTHKCLAGWIMVHFIVVWVPIKVRHKLGMTYAAWSVCRWMIQHLVTYTFCYLHLRPACNLITSLQHFF